jgi:hypothetical protein
MLLATMLLLACRTAYAEVLHELIFPRRTAMSKSVSKSGAGRAKRKSWK